MSGALVSPDLFALGKVLIRGIMKIKWDAILAGAPVGSPAEPLRGVAYFLMDDGFLTFNAWMIAITIMVTWAAAIQLLTMMWIERKFYSRLQDRYGIMISIWSLPFWPFSWWAKRRNKPTHRGLGYLQNVADGVKLLQKENITPAKADSAMFHTAPVMIASSTIMIFAALPFSEGFVIANVPMSLLFILAAFSIAPLGILIAGWSSNNKYSLIGGMRAAAQLMAYEIPLRLAGCALVVILYLGGWSGPVFVTLTPAVGNTPIPIPIPPHEVWFLLKVYLLYLVFVWVSWSVPRVRIDQILNIGWKRLIPLSLLAILLAAGLAAFGPALGGVR